MGMAVTGRRVDFLAGFLILVAGPILVIGGLWGWAVMTAGQPRSGPLSLTADRVLVMDGAVALQTGFAGMPAASGGTPLPPPPIDLLVLVDVSGSTGSTRPELLSAIESVGNDLLLSGAAANRVAVISFDHEARVEADWTASADRVSAHALAPLLERSGGNDSRAMFRELDTIVARSRPQARRLAVFYTDGAWVACVQCRNPMEWPEVESVAASLRSRGIELFVVGVPNNLDTDHMAHVTGTPDRVLVSANQSELTAQLRSVTVTNAEIAAIRARLTLPVDGRLFDAQTGDSGWSVDPADGRLARRIQPLHRSPTTFSVTLHPNALGYVPATYAPAQLRFPNPDGDGDVELRSGPPSVLVVSPLFLLVAFAPALGWAGLALLPGPKRQAPPPSRLPYPLPPSPVQVLRLPAPPDTTEAAVPTLIVGLGGWGCGAAFAVRSHLTATGDDGMTPPVSFLAIDVDRGALEQAAPARSGGEDLSVTTLPAPSCVTDANQWLRDRIPDAAHPGGVWSGLPLAAYRNASRQELSLEHGVHGDRTLGRAALLRWFEDGGLAAALQDGLQALMARPAADGVRQIVVLVNMAGGFGSAAALDVARVLRRQARAAQAADALIPEIICIAADSPVGTAERARRTAFLRECHTASRLASHPRTVLLGAARPEFAATDDEAPFDTVMTVSSDLDDAATQAVVLSDALLSPRPRRVWLPAMDRVARPVVTVAARALTVPAAAERRLVEQEFLLRVIGRHLLGGIAPDPAGSGYDVQAPSAPRLSELVAQIRAAEPPASPWALLLQAAVEPPALPAFLAMVAQSDGSAPEWIARAAAAALTARLSAAPGMPPGISMTPPEAAALSEWLEQRISGPLAREAAGLGATPDAMTALETVARSFSAMTGDWRRWTRHLLTAANEAAAESARLRAATAPATGALSILAVTTDGDAIGRRLDQVFAVWLREQSSDAKDLHSHLSFAVAVENGTPMPLLRSRIGWRTDHRDPEAAVAMLRKAANLVVGLAGPRRIDGALAAIPTDETRRLAETLVTASQPAAGALLVRPGAPDLAAAAVIDAFCRNVTDPAGCPSRLEATAYGHATVARIAWGPPRPSQFTPGALPVVQPLDLGAERLRLRLIQVLDRQIDELPIDLVLATADPVRFRSFARLYRAGRLSERADPWGRRSWYLDEPGIFLTQGDGSLAAAAASFVGIDPAPDVLDGPASGDFALLEDWMRSKTEPGADALERLLTLAAVSIALDEEALV